MHRYVLHIHRWKEPFFSEVVSIELSGVDKNEIILIIHL